MGVESAADRLAFLTVAGFGVAVIYTLAAGGVTSGLTGIFDNETGRDFAGPGAQANAPHVDMRTADIPAGAVAGAASGDRLAIAADTYQPLAFDHDGTGMTVIRLRKI